MATPYLVTPSRAKAVYAARFASLWHGLGQAGGLNLGLVVIGFSLSPQDEHAKQALFRLVRNYQDSWWEIEWPHGQTKTPVLLVDRKQTIEDRQAYQERYGFVKPEKAKFHFDGFDMAAVELMERAETAS